VNKWTMAFFFSCMLIFSLTWTSNHAEAATKLAYGSSNGDVWDLQYRLQALGYYSKPLDGKYGKHTTYAVRNFQKAYGLPVDGITGKRTWSKLKKFSLNQYEMDMMARLIHSEARGESYTGQVAVGAVVMNRIQSPKFPNTIRSVVFERGAFTAVDDGQYWLKPDRTAYKAAFDAVRGWDPTRNSLYYFNPKTATSKWIWSRPQMLKIGNHIFAR
jgi:N-acetylmuramoyl-L-alanine amidase